MNGYKGRPPGRSVLLLNTALYHQLVNERGWTIQSEQALGLGLSQQSISKILLGDQLPGNNAIAALWRAFPDRVMDLFEPVPEADLASAQRSAA